MDASQIHDHWTDWATRYGTDLRATTKSPTAKVLELDALSRHLRAILAGRKSANVLEVGCGNGINCLALAQALPQARFDGVDYVREMVAAAVQSAQSAQQPNMILPGQCPGARRGRGSGCAVRCGVHGSLLDQPGYDRKAAACTQRSDRQGAAAG